MLKSQSTFAVTQMQIEANQIEKKNESIQPSETKAE
jgi:hypothetical protein